MDFEKHFANATQFVQDVANELGCSDDHARAIRILRTVLHTLRERLTTTESFDLLAELPLVIKGLYVDGWKPRQIPMRIRDIHDFASLVISKSGTSGQRDFESEEDVIEAIGAVFAALKFHISVGESKDIESILPQALKGFWVGCSNVY